MTTKPTKQKHHEAGEIIASFGLKSAIGKTTVIRCGAELCDVIGRKWSGISVDRSERLPLRYPGKFAQVQLPTDGEGRLDAYAQTRAFFHLDEALDRAIEGKSILFIDVGSGEYPRAIIEHSSRSRLNSLLVRNNISFTALLVTTADPMVMSDIPRLAEAVLLALPSARVMIVLNERNGQFRFADGSEARKVSETALDPALQKYPSITIPAMPNGCWDKFEDQGLRFSEVALLNPEESEVDERKLISWTHESRSLAIARQGDVAEWLHAAWQGLSRVIVDHPHDVGGDE